MQITGRQIGIAAGIAAVGIVADQVLKAYVRTHAEPGTLRTHDGRTGQLPIVWDPKGTDEFTMVYVENRGEPILTGGGDRSRVWPQAVMTAAAPLVAASVLYSGATMPGAHGAAWKTAAAIGAGLMLAGGVSNGVEKVVRREVTDMLLLSRTNVAWNLADIALVSGVAVSAVVLGARLLTGMR